MSTWDLDRYLSALDREAAALRASFTLEGVDPSGPVPPCPGWTIGDLVGHMGAVFRRIEGVLRRRSLEPAPAFTNEFPEDVLAFYDSGYTALVDALRVTPPDTPVWNWAPAAKLASFWPRRAATETAVHRWDLQVSINQPEPIEQELAEQGVHEIFDAWLPAGRRKGPLDRQGLVQLVDTEGNEWFVRVRGEGLALLDTATLVPDEHRPQVIASGPASDIMLSLMGRVPFDVLTIEGDAGLLSALRTG
ncbi:hypothetical protein Afil01_22110 [Actinorhabdospora filicis]|uniref:Mycothiol-dependent maleylpyruvate isomerase metal-binding domain-containing protein n=1 Tax=Actinorhabdospora filicis TaxID=1785913 RepID=A0A9W6W8A9_9ACTN|nr:maleylpyruvate isomerase family mycothiol-dependent enzyme [Actinorhabdospora filicis]GLZ77404.1 hypothetical protein Afil01_22110 [Actinorhabdospora filicis]